MRGSGGGRSGGFSGGGHSGGFVRSGSGRGSFSGGRSSSFSGGRSSSFSGSHSSGGGVHFGGPRPSGGRYYYHGGGNRRGSGGCGSGCFGFIAVIILMIVAISFFSSVLPVACASLSCAGAALSSCSSTNAGTTTIVASTTEREKLDWDYKDTLKNIGLWTDNIQWFNTADSDLRSGMMTFYDETGIRPYLYLVSEEDSVAILGSDEAMIEYANNLYDTLFDGDEGYFLVTYFPCEGDTPAAVEGMMYYLCGDGITSVMDDNACEMFTSYWNYYYSKDGLTIGQFFGKIFSTTGEKMMKHSLKVRYVVLIIVLVIAAVVVVITVRSIVKAKIKQRNKETEDLERILDKPLETFGTDYDKVRDLKAKYDDKEDDKQQ